MQNHYFDEGGYYAYSGYANPENACPLNALRVEPVHSAEHGEWSKFVDGAWVVFTDMRGTKYYMPDGTEAEMTEFEAILPEGASFTKPDPVPEPEPESLGVKVMNSSKKVLGKLVQK